MYISSETQMLTNDYFHVFCKIIGVFAQKMRDGAKNLFIPFLDAHGPSQEKLKVP